MRTTLKKTLFAVLPLGGLLFLTSPVFAHGDENGHGRHERFHDKLGDLHEQKHDKLGALHEEFHEYPYSRREHRRFHRGLKREHKDFHNDLYDWHDDYHDRGWRWGRRYGDDYYRGRYGSQRPYGSWWYYGAGDRPWWR